MLGVLLVGGHGDKSGGSHQLQHWGCWWLAGTKPDVELEVDGAWTTQSVLKKTINNKRGWLSTP